MLNFVFFRGVVSFILVSRGLETPKPPNLSQKRILAGDFCEEWRSAISSSENLSPLLALWYGRVMLLDVGGDLGNHGEIDCGDEGIPKLPTVTSYENH